MHCLQFSRNTTAHVTVWSLTCPKSKFSRNTTRRLNINCCCVLSSTKYELWGYFVPRTDVGDLCHLNCNDLRDVRVEFVSSLRFYMLFSSFVVLMFGLDSDNLSNKTSNEHTLQQLFKENQNTVPVPTMYSTNLARNKSLKV